MLQRRLYAHRGAAAECPENTMLAFERAIEIGVDALEMDVQLTRDGQLIVAHDDDCARTTGARGTWAERDLVEARALDAGWGYIARDGSRPFAGRDVVVPTFAEVLDRFPSMTINVDLKGNSVPAMLELVKQKRAEDRVTIASFQTSTLIAVRRAGYPGSTGLSVGEVAALLVLPGVLWRQLPYTGMAVQVPTHQGIARFDRAGFIAKCHSIGLRVDFWTIDAPAEAERLLALGADGIITNDPRTIGPIVRRGA